VRLNLGTVNPSALFFLDLGDAVRLHEDLGQLLTDYYVARHGDDDGHDADAPGPSDP
jgi:hypothetical protein